jgi:hypothetical protein
MYKIIALTSILVSFAIAADAQESYPKILSRFELIAGPSFSKNNGYLPDYKSKTGFSFGVGYYQNLSKSFSINMRTLYETKGSSVVYQYNLTDLNNNSVDVDNRYNTKFKYLTFYLLPTLQLGKTKNIHLSAGGYYSFLQKLSVTSYSTRTDNGAFISEYENNSKNYFTPNFDAGLSFQLGYAFNISKKSQLMLQAFANRGLVDLHNDAFGSQRMNTYGLQLSFRMR